MDEFEWQTGTLTELMGEGFRHPQFKKNDDVRVKDGAFDYLHQPAHEVAEKVARICYGLWDWQGIREFEAPAGLTRLANAWLRKNTTNGARVCERQTYRNRNGDWLSIYCLARIK